MNGIEPKKGIKMSDVRPNVFRFRIIRTLKRLVLNLSKEGKNIFNKIRESLENRSEAKLLITYHSEALRLRRNLGFISPVKLNFGCGQRILKSWINID